MRYLWNQRHKLPNNAEQSTRSNFSKVYTLKLSLLGIYCNKFNQVYLKMKNLRKLYPGYFNLLFIHFNYKEKKSVLALFLLISANSSLYFIILSGNILLDTIQGYVAALNIAVVANLLFSNTRKINERVVKEFYQIDILRYTKASQLELIRSVFIRNIVIKYDKYEDLIADYDDGPPTSGPNIKKAFGDSFCSLRDLLGSLEVFCSMERHLELSWLI